MGNSIKYILINLLLISFIFSTTNAENLNSENFIDTHFVLPANIEPLKLYFDNIDTFYVTSRSSGIYKRKIGESRWKNINSNLFRRRTTIPNIDQYRKISAFSASGPKLILCTKHSIYRSIDSGENWKKLNLKGADITHYYTAAAEDNKGNIYIGTSYKGVYKISGNRLIDISTGLPSEKYSSKKYFYESVSSIHVSQEGILYAGFLFNKGIYKKDKNSREWHNLTMPMTGRNQTEIIDIKTDNLYLYVSTSRGLNLLNKDNKRWKSENFDKEESLSFKIVNYNYKLKQAFDKRNQGSPYKKKIANNKRAIYATIWQAKRKTKSLIETLKKTNMNSIVIDVKDDSGDIFIPIKNKTAIQINANKTVKDFKKVLDELKKNNIYTIARIVVFKDMRLYKAFNNKYAIQDSLTNKAWKGNSKEFWVDAFSDDVRNYNIDIAKEAANFGFDEIQFDYIRFPADGPIYRCFYKYKKDKNTYKSEILADFLQKASQEIYKPISVDIYGFNGWYNFGNIIGQDIETFAEYVDAVCPMVYPSHFGSSFFKTSNREERPYNIVFNSGIRSIRLSNYKAIIRPYIQAFNLMSPTWGPGYITKQVKAAKDSKCNGFIFWNASSDYSMVKKAMSN